MAALGLLFSLLPLVGFGNNTPCQAPTDADPTSEAVATAAHKLLKSTFPTHGGILCVAIRDLSISAAATPELVAGFVNVPDKIPRGTTRLRLHSGASDEEGWATVYVSHFDTLAVLTDPLPRGETMLASSIAPALHDVTQSGHQYARYRDLVTAAIHRELIATVNLSAGALIRVTATTTRPVLQRGAAVTMVHQRGDVTLRIPVVVREDAAVGDEIRARNTEFRTNYRVVVLDATLVRWVATL